MSDQAAPKTDDVETNEKKDESKDKKAKDDDDKERIDSTLQLSVSTFEKAKELVFSRSKETDSVFAKDKNSVVSSFSR